MAQPTTFQDAASILAARYCMKPIIIEGVLRDLSTSPVKATARLSAMPFSDVMDLLFQKARAIPLLELQAASWNE